MVGDGGHHAWMSHRCIIHRSTTSSSLSLAMNNARFLLLALACHSWIASAQTKSLSSSGHTATATTVADTSDDADDPEEPRLQYGVAAGALQYGAGRSEQALGVVFRWLPVRYLSLSITPTTARVREPGLTATSGDVIRSGLTDMPVEATLSKSFAGALSPSVSASLGASLPVGDTASGLGAGEMGYSMSGGIGLVPATHVSLYVGAGRSLTGFSSQAAFSSGAGWGDASLGYAMNDRASASGGFSFDIGAVDSTLGRALSLDGGASFVIGGGRTLNINVSHGVSGSAPSWSMALGFGTAFPYLNHVGARSADPSLTNTFGGGTHGLPNGATSGSSNGKSNGKGRGRSG
jgi:hypothetical protein